MAFPWRAIAALALVGLSGASRIRDRELYSDLSEHGTEGGLPCAFEVSFDKQKRDQDAADDDLIDVIKFRAICTELVKDCFFKRPYLEKKDGRFLELPFTRAFKVGENSMGTFRLEDEFDGATYVGKTFTFKATKADGEGGELSITIPSKADWEAAMKEKLEGSSLPALPGTLSYENVPLDPSGVGYKILLELEKEVTTLELFAPPSMQPVAKKTVPVGGNYLFTILSEDQVAENRVVMIGRLGLQEVVKVLVLTPKGEQEVKKDEAKNNQEQSPQQPSDKKATEAELSDAKCVLIREKDSEDGGVLTIEISVKCDVDVKGDKVALEGGQYLPLNGQVFRANKKKIFSFHKEQMQGRELWFEGTADGKAVRSNKEKIESGPQEWIEPEKKKIEAGDARCTISRGKDFTAKDDGAPSFSIMIECNTDVTDGKVMLSGSNQYFEFGEQVFEADREYPLIKLGKAPMKGRSLWFEGKVKDGGAAIRSNAETIE